MKIKIVVRWIANSIVLICGVVLLYYLPYIIRISMKKKGNNLKDSEGIDLSEYKIIKHDSCYMKEPPLWWHGISEWHNHDLKFPKCTNDDTNEYYTIKHGIISLKKSNITNLSYCKYQCATSSGEKSTEISEFIFIIKSSKLKCDIFYISCHDKADEKLFENFEIEIVPIDDIPPKEVTFLKSTYDLPKTTKKYDIFIYVLDSLSKLEARRTLTKSRNILLNQGGIEMEYLNIVGDNSPPNAFALLMNLQMDNVSDLYGTKPTKINDFGQEDSCEMPLDDKTFIFDYINQLGYVTFSGEDYFKGIFGHPDCVAFLKDISHHNLRPIQHLFVDEGQFVEFIAKRFEKKCHDKGTHILESFEKFLNEYKNKSKSALIWHTHMVHEGFEYTYAFDEILEDFLTKNTQSLNNSFFIFMGDHGSRSDYRYSEPGKHEHRNPYFIIKLPYDLQNNSELIDNLKKNSLKHLSMYDVYATLLDLITEASKNNFQNLQPYDLSNVVNYKIKGMSLFRPLPDKKRTCYELHVPRIFCMCGPDYQPLPIALSDEYVMLKKNFITGINKKLEENKLTDICSEISLDEEETFIVNRAISENNITLYEVKATTLPGKAQFLAYFDSDYSLIDNDIIRLNRYAEQAEICAPYDSNRMYCFCKSLLNE